MIFDEYMEAAALRLKEPESATSDVRFSADIPYVIKSELEHIVVMALNQVIGEVAPEDWDSFSSVAVKVVSGGAVQGNWSVMSMPYNLRKVYAASIDGAECTEVGMASFIQTVGTSTRYSAVYVLAPSNGAPAVLFRGVSITLTYLVEPSMDDWKNATTPILPPGYDIRVLDIVSKRVLVSDYVLEWGG